VVEEEPLDLVLEGKAVKVRDAATLGRVADAYAKVYGWRAVVPSRRLIPRGARSAEGAHDRRC